MKISAIVTASWRRPQLFETLRTLQGCTPPPDEILLHVDGGNHALVKEVKVACPAVVVLEASEKLGPGGSRNRLLAAARNEWVASFDDDSHPFDAGFFATVARVVETYPEAAIIACQIFEPCDPMPSKQDDCRRVTDFVGCGCLYRREVFMASEGCVPLPLAYGMEEVDLSLRYLDAGQVIVFAPMLRVVHNTDPANREAPAAVAASIANILLRAWLRYPWLLVWLGVLQAMHRTVWLIFHGRRKGVWQAMGAARELIQHHAWRRRPVRARSLLAYQWRRRTGWKT